MKKDNLCESLSTLIKNYLKTLKLNKQIVSSVYLESPSQKEYGDLSVNLALKLSKLLKRNPSSVADSIVSYLNEKIKDTNLKEYIASIQIAGGGFINFFLTDNYFRRVLKDILILGNNFGRNNLGCKRKVLMEFVSANPTGPLSIAHARQAAVGDALCNILEFLGFRVKREYYLNDEGNQIDLLGKSIEARFRELLGKPTELPEGGYEGEYIREIAKEILKLKKSGANEQGLEFFSDYGVKYILKIIKEELKDFGITFDSWYSQKKLTKSGKIKKVLEWLKKRDFIYKKEGAFWFRSSAFGDDKDRVVIKNDGLYTYLAPDIAYHKDKYQRGFH